MEYTRPATLIALSALALTTLSGCGGQQRATTLDAEPACYADKPVCATSSSTQPDEMVIGTEFTFDDLPIYETPANTLSLPQIANELIAMHTRDRDLVRDATTPNQSKATLARVEAIDRAHTARLKEIVDYIGWPTRGTVGLAATEGAYLVVQHAGNDTVFQTRCLSMMHELADRGELPAPYVALLTDRIHAFNGDPQVYGTQMILQEDSNGVMHPVPSIPIAFPESLDQRRTAMDMPPHEHFVAAIAQAYARSLEGEPDIQVANAPTD